MAFIENENNKDWVLLFRSYCGNATSLPTASDFPSTSIDQWTKGDTNVAPSTEGLDGNFKFQGGMDIEPSPTVWYQHCNRGKMYVPSSNNIPIGIPPIDGNQLLDRDWGALSDGTYPPDVELTSSGNYYPKTQLVPGQNGIEVDDKGTGGYPEAEYSYPSISYPIIWRKVTPGSRTGNDFRKIPEWAYNIYYKRITNWNMMNIKTLFLENFGKTGFQMTDKTQTVGNLPDIDFELYSTLEDAEAEDDGTWWNQMTEEEKLRYNKPKNPKRWKIYGQGSKIETEDNSPTTSFGDMGKVGFPSNLGPTIGNNNITGGLTPRIPGIFSPGGIELEGVIRTSDDVARQPGSNKALEEGSLSRDGDYDSARTGILEDGNSVPIQAAEWKIYVLARERGCALDFDSKKSNGAPLVNTKYINLGSMPEHLKCTDEAPVCNGYQPWSGKYDYDLSTKYAAGPGQTWGQCRGLSMGEVTALKEKAILESTAQRISDMQSLKVNPKESIREPGKMSTIWNESEFARVQRLSGGLRILDVLEQNGNIINSDQMSKGKAFLYDQESFDRMFPQKIDVSQITQNSNDGIVIQVEHKRSADTSEGSDEINYEFVSGNPGTILKVVFYRRPNGTEFQNDPTSKWLSYPPNMGYGRLIGVQGPNGTWVNSSNTNSPFTSGNPTNTIIKNINRQAVEVEYVANPGIPDVQSPGQSDRWLPGDILVPAGINEKLAAAVAESDATQDNVFAEAAFKNLASRYDQRLSQLEDQDKVLQMQLNEIKKKNDKIGAKKFKMNREQNELMRTERQITLDQNLDNQGKKMYNALTMITGVSSLVILGFIIKGM